MLQKIKPELPRWKVFIPPRVSGKSVKVNLINKMMMNKENIAFRAKEYLFHLNNANDENGIRPYEGWKFARVDLAGRAAIEHAYHPTVATEIAEKDMDNFVQNVLHGLEVSYPNVHVADQKIQNNEGGDHFVAFCADRVRR